jgi:endonuclease YncB( thermonuclease family)
VARRGRFRIIKGGQHSDPLRFWPEARRKPGWSRFLPLWTGAIAVGLLVGASWSQWPGWPGSAPHATSVANYAQLLEQRVELPDAGVRANFNFCHTGGGDNCVVDGDTIWLKGVKIRIADIDAPETHDPKCASELQRGNRATQRLLQLVNSGTVTLRSIDRDEDRYGRKLRIVMVDGRSVGDTLVGEGLARPYGNGRRPWC